MFPLVSRLRSMSLERKLPLLMTAVLTTVMGVALVLTYRTLRESAAATARERLLRGAQSIAGTVEPVIADRRLRARRFARGPLAAAARSRDTTRIAAALRAYRAELDSNRVELWTPAGVPTVGVGTIGDGERARAFSEWLAGGPLPQLVGDTAGVTPFYIFDDNVHFWVVAAVVSGRDTLGYVAHKRRLTGSPDVLASLTGMLGEGVSLHMRNRQNDVWAAAPSEPESRPVRRDTAQDAAFDIMPDGRRLLATEVAIRGTPFILVLQAPWEPIMARPRTLVFRLMLLGIGLAALGAALAWGISRRITRPLASLSHAARSLSTGDYGDRVEVHGEDEVGQLAKAFNRMAADIQASHGELQRRTSEAEAARADAERANRAKADFLAVMSHELRTPLNAISGYVELLELEVYGPLSAGQRDALARIAHNQQHLLALINDVLNFAKIDAGQVHYAIRDVSLAEMLTAVEPLIAPQLRAKQLHFRSAGGDPALLVRADPDKLQQVLLNLLTNAIKFTPSGGDITVAVRDEDHVVRVVVADTGVGIPADRLPSIFDPFVQGDRALNNPHEGVGLGLAIARDLARGMGGDIVVQSETGRGSSFTITLARATGVRPAEAHPGSMPAGTPLTPA